MVYADIDPVAIAHSQAILAGQDDAAIIEADLRDPAAILDDPATRRLIDFSQPAGLLLIAILHFIADAEDPWQLVRTLRDALAPGSYLVLSHGTDEGTPEVARAVQERVQPWRRHRAARPFPGRDHALLRWFRDRRARAGVHPAVAAGLARRGTG